MIGVVAFIVVFSYAAFFQSGPTIVTPIGVDASTGTPVAAARRRSRPGATVTQRGRRSLAPPDPPPHPMKTILLFRHAKSDWTAETPDIERPLAARGHKAAAKMGRLITASGCMPERALVSSAVRTRETARLAAEAGFWKAPERVTDALYEATPEAVLAEIQAEPDDAATLVVIGHEPTTSRLAALLVGGGHVRGQDRLGPPHRRARRALGRRDGRAAARSSGPSRPTRWTSRATGSSRRRPRRRRRRPARPDGPGTPPEVLHVVPGAAEAAAPNAA